MDVVCERCRAEYEFDDALVSERGTTVKCTSCGHQFKIYRATADADGGRVWNLRRPDGTVIPFDSLAVLQKWILEGKVRKMDEISRAGEPWKSLGAIAELESFFATAELRSSHGSAARGPTAPPLGTSGAGGPVVRAPSRPPPLTRTTLRPGGGAPPPGSPPSPVLRAPSNGPPPLPSGLRGPSSLRGPAPGSATGSQGASLPPLQVPAAPKLPSPAVHMPLADELEPLRPPPSASASNAGVAKRSRSEVPRDLPDLPLATFEADLDEAPVRARRRGLGAGLVVGGVVAALALAGAWKAGLLAPRAPSAAPRPAVDASRTVAEAIAKSRSYTAAMLDDAREDLSAAVAVSPGDGAVRSARAEVLAAWAELLSTEATDLEAQASQPGADAARLRASAESLRRDAALKVTRARSDLSASEASLSAVPVAERPTVEARLADVARVVGAETVASHVAAARVPHPSAEAVLYLALARAADDPAGASAALREVVAANTQDLRARVALARLLQRSGDTAGARELLDESARVSPEHEAVLALQRTLGATTSADAGAQTVPSVAVAPPPPVEPPPPAVAVAPVVPAAAPTPAPQPVEPRVAVAPAAPAVPRPASGPSAGLEALPPGLGGYDRLVADADRLQHAGRSSLARERYLQAIGLRPTGCEALTGLGFVELDSESIGAAVSKFRQALAANPRYSEAYIGLGEAYSHQHSYGQAVQAYQQYIQINPGGSRAEMARRQIESLQERMSTTRPADGADAGGT